MASLLKNFSGVQLFSNYIKQSIGIVSVPNRGKKINPPPRKRHPEWLPKPEHSIFNEALTEENKEFIQEFAESKYGPHDTGLGMRVSILKDAPIEPNTQWTKDSRRTGLIARKIGIYPMWLKNGQKVSTTLLQVVDNEVVKYIPPKEFNPVVHSKHLQVKRKLGCLVVGSGRADPQKITKEYAGIFNAAGIAPKKQLMRFVVSPDAALQPGTPLYAAHYKPGDIVDIRAKTTDRGFQGVMKRWGFKGMPASHGVTKTHRRPGNIGSGSSLARVFPGTKMPGHMGNRWRVHRGIRIIRINTKYNVIWILGQNLPGETNSYCYIYDTLLPLKKYKTSPYFPTYLPGISEESIPEDLFADDVHSFNEPTIEFTPES